jgi:RHS repeat-associated protein
MTLGRAREWTAVVALTGALSPAALAVNSGRVEYYHHDALGNVRVVTDKTGQVLERHDYLPFGEECTTGACAANPGLHASQPRKFIGKERDAETGLDYFGARYYAQQAGRFTSIDPVHAWRENLVDPQRWNRYAYGRNNPLRYVDPDGRDILDYVGGAANAFGSNFFAGAGRASGGNADFRFGQFVGDSFSIPAGAAWAEGGVAAGGVGVLGAAPSGGVSLVASGVGAAVAAQGVTAAVSGAAHAGHYLAKQLGEAGGPKVGSEGGPGAGRRFSSKTRDAARAENPNCVFCDRPTTGEPGPTQSNIDHAKAKARGGNNATENAQNTCRECNQRKGAKSSEEFLRRQ